MLLRPPNWALALQQAQPPPCWPLLPPLQVLTYGIATAAILRLVLIVAGVDIGEGWVAGQQAASLRGSRRKPSQQLFVAAASTARLPARPALAVERFEPVMLLFAGILILSSAKLLL